jgi:hypothetical protein
MSIWQAIKNAFVPWNLILRDGPPEHEGVRTIDYGQLLIDGSTGDISDMAQVVEQTQKRLASSEHEPKLSRSVPEQ